MIIIKLLGIFFAYIGGYSCLVDLLKRKRCKEITNGKVVDIYEKVKNKSDGRTKVFLYPVFEYNVMGNTYTQKSDVGHGSRSSKYAIGQEVEIKYNSNKPEEYYIKGDFESIQGKLIIMIVGLFLILVV